MKLQHSLKWMFFGSIIIGIFLNGMNVLAYRYSDLYLSNTLIYSALLMASNMCVLETLMFYDHTKKLELNTFIFFIILSLTIIALLREQTFIDDNEWLKRMISHHSTALTTSHKINERTKNEEIKKLSRDIIDTQEKEIKMMKELLKN